RELRRALATKNTLIQQTRKTILDPIWKSIMDNKSYEPDERNIYMLMTEKFVNRLGALNWYIITKFVKDENFSQILNVLRLKLVEYMEKSRIAEYSSLMVMELAANNENSNIKKEAKAIYNDVDNINSLVLDHSIREKIIQILKQKKEMIYISWKLGGSSSALGKQNRLQITLYNKDDEFQEVKESIESKMSADLNKKSLIDFYQNSQDGDGQDLGLYYLTYLDDACKKVNVRFESIVNQFSSSDLTVINLIFHF
ncbi:MAG: hypothetical protein K6F69_10465, partial [Treponema sp.]|nr:hypothetical protein [Treponema sp.]